MTDPIISDTEFQDEVRKRFLALPKVIQDVITSTDVQNRMRELANKNSLHVDQWEALETEVQMALMGIQPLVDLQKNIQREVGVTGDIARSLVENINLIVFAPIREELERHLGHPQAKDEEATQIEEIREAAIAEERKNAEPTVQPGTPPPPPPTTPVMKGPSSGEYVPGKPSSERVSIVDDPYREAP